MSPNRLVVTMTSNCQGFITSCIAQARAAGAGRHAAAHRHQPNGGTMARGHQAPSMTHCANHARNHFFLACDLNEIPRRFAIFFRDSGERPVCLTTSSSEVEERASSINRRSSLNDQRCLRTIVTLLFGQGRQAEYVHLAVSSVGRSGPKLSGASIGI